MRAALDPFAVLGLAPRFALLPAELDRRQRELHLERQAEGPLAIESINAAVRQLKEPASRAEQLFLLRGWSTAPVAEPALLERVFSEREFVERARQRRDLAALRSWAAAASARRQMIVEAMSQLLDGPSAKAEPIDELPTVTVGATATEETSRRAGRLLEELRYLARAMVTAQSAIEALEDAAEPDLDLDA